MKKLILIFAVLATVSSCSFVKDVQKHCVVSQTEADVFTGSFNACLKCDSLAQVVKNGIAKAEKK